MEEPLGVAFVRTSLYKCCFRSGLKFQTGTSFAARFCEEVHKIYVAVGYKPRSKEVLPQYSFRERLTLLREVSEFMTEINDRKRQHLGRKYISTEHGGIYPYTLVCLNETINSLEEVSNLLKDYGLDECDIDFYSCINESVVEHSFGKGVQQTQYSVPTHQEYAKQKVGSSHNLIRKCCEMPFYYPSNENRQYNYPLKVKIEAKEIFRAQAKIAGRRKQATTEEESKELRQKIKSLKEISCIYKPQPTQAARAKYKARCGSAPSVTPFVPTITVGQVKITDMFKPSESVSDNQEKALVAGDVVGVLAGEDADGHPSKDDWWLFKVSRDIFQLKQGTHINGHWLDFDETDSEGNQLFTLQDNTERWLSYKTILKDQERNPYIILKEHYVQRNTKDSLTVVISPDTAEELTAIALRVDTVIDQEEIGHADQEEEEATVEVNAVPLVRQRVLQRRGLRIKSYKDLHMGK